MSLAAALLSLPPCRCQPSLLPFSHVPLLRIVQAIKKSKTNVPSVHAFFKKVGIACYVAMFATSMLATSPHTTSMLSSSTYATSMPSRK